MSPTADDLERQRAARISAQQIAARNPGVSKIRGYDWASHAKRAHQIKSTRKRGLIALFNIFPGRWRGVAMGLTFSLPWSLIGVLLLPEEFDALALLPMLICGIGGYVLGSTLEEKTF